MKSKLLAGLLLAGSSLFAQRFSVGVSIGAPPPPPAYYYSYARPVAPGPGYVWVDGFYELRHNRYVWRQGYWTRPPHRRAYWIAPRYERGRYYAGYWR